MKKTRVILFLSWCIPYAFSSLMLPNQKCGEGVSSENGVKLNKESYHVSDVTGFGERLLRCLRDPLCQSFNLRLSTLECMLLQYHHFNANLTKTDDDWVYMPNLKHPCYNVSCKRGGRCVRTGTNSAECSYSSSCSFLHQRDGGIKSGYYVISVSGTTSKMYCDMETRGKPVSLAKLCFTRPL